MSRKEKANITRIRRIKSAPRGKAYKEICVVFAESNTRDEILMRAPMLSSFRDDKGHPTAGIRLRIPGHLMGAFKTLEAFGHRLKKQYGESFKKHIKFEEYDYSLYIQVGIKTEGEPVDWTKYTAEQARESNKKVDERRRGPKIDFLSSQTSTSGSYLSRGEKTNGAAGAASGTSGTSGTGGRSGQLDRRKSSCQTWRPPARDDKKDNDSDDAME